MSVMYTFNSSDGFESVESKTIGCSPPFSVCLYAHLVALPATRLYACSTYNTWKSNRLNPETFRTAPSG